MAIRAYGAPYDKLKRSAKRPSLSVYKQHDHHKSITQHQSGRAFIHSQIALPLRSARHSRDCYTASWVGCASSLGFPAAFASSSVRLSFARFFVCIFVIVPRISSQYIAPSRANCHRSRFRFSYALRTIHNRPAFVPCVVHTTNSKGTCFCDLFIFDSSNNLWIAGHFISQR